MKNLKITTIQSSLFWEDKSSNLDMFRDKIQSISGQPEIVLLPEMFNTGFSMDAKRLAETMEGSTIEWMRNMAIEKKIILTGSLIIEEGGQYFNRMIWMLPTGELAYYDKRHLFGYAGEDKHFTAGNKKLIASVKGWKINLQVCYDLRFPVWARQQGTHNTHVSEGEETPEPTYDVLINIANWPAARSHAWKTLLCARAIENQCYVVGVNRVGKDGNGHYYSGDTSVFDALGQTLYQVSDDEDIFTIMLEKTALREVREKFPFWRDGDEFLIK